MIAVEMDNNKTSTTLAEKHDRTFDEAKNVMIRFAVLGVMGNYEDEISQLDHSPHSN